MDRTRATRTSASSLVVTFRHDGALLLELVVDWYSVLATAECDVADPAGIVELLTSWATSPDHEARPRRFAGPSLVRASSPDLERDYSRGVVVVLAGEAPRERPDVGGQPGDERLFADAFGSRPPADLRRVENFADRLARQTGRYFRRARAKADARLAGGAYLTVLRDQLSRLRAARDDQSAYRRFEHTLAAIVEDERYLRLAGDDEVRELVEAIDAELGLLYGRCMDLERGGHVR